MNNFKKPNLQVYKGNLTGGFVSLTENQISKIKGGKKDLDSNGTCTNQNDCTTTTNDLVCSNTGNC